MVPAGAGGTQGKMLNSLGRRMKRILHSFRSFSRPLGPLEQRVLDALWARRSATVRELLENSYPELAYTTVMTTLDRLFKKGLLTRSEEGRAFRYAPRFSREEMHREAASMPFANCWMRVRLRLCRFLF